MKYVVQNGSSVKLADVTCIKEELPLGTYNLAFDPSLAEFYLEKCSDLEVPNKIYGNIDIVDRAIQVYKHKDRNFGLMLYGLKGSGKTLAMRLIAKKLNQPVIIINDNFGNAGTEAIKFLSEKVLGDCTILIDEYEKKFNPNDDTPLTLLDGPYPTHHFFILTANEASINENMRNRPGRIYYTVSYAGLDNSIVSDVADDLLINKDFKDELFEVCEDLANLSFDMLISIINDVNLFNESPKTVIKWFGFTKESQYATVYQKVNGKLIDPPVMESIYMNIANSRNYQQWCDVRLAEHLPAEEYILLDLSKLIKIRKNTYSVTQLCTPAEIREQSTKAEKTKIKQKLEAEGIIFEPDSFKIKLEFEIHMSSSCKPKYVY